MCDFRIPCFADAYVYLSFQLIKATFACGRSVSFQFN